MLRSFALPALLFCALVSALSAASPLAGTWRIDLARSTDLTPWRELTVTITVDGSRLTLHRHFANGRRTFDETLPLDLAQAVNVVPVTWWPDNRHLGAYIGGDRQKLIHATLLDDGRILRLSADLTLATSQGERAVNILSDYKVSANGALLTLTELRSTRNQPVVYTFTRVAPAPTPAR